MSHAQHIAERHLYGRRDEWVSCPICADELHIADLLQHLLSSHGLHYGQQRSPAIEHDWPKLPTPSGQAQRQRRDEWIDWVQSLLNPASSAPPAAAATMEEDGRAPSKEMTRRRNGRSSTTRKSKEVYGQNACPYCLLEGNTKTYAAQQGSAHLASHLFEIREKKPACPVCSETVSIVGLFAHLEGHGFALSGSATDKTNGKTKKVYSGSSGDTRAKKESMAWVSNGCPEDTLSPPQAKKRKVAAGPSHSVASSARPAAAGPSGCAASLARSATAGPTAHTNTALRPLSACRGGRPQPNYRLSSASDDSE
ncbi:hypothetical protein BDZ90DRAFT_263141 [Jaminaea rosea]|uniref:Uncharacterized protein n=1 Tax=Jaminaea rosea TaxID=1569628 RepID=A0A316UH63_9BASI|nr:hypothetical protein BDZ90DRAFT_263141 [Jaminaea rosea]PWN24596.1 hypothetical protein BDZ90DRAFT_263141 [Jaminaea rosea]